MDRKLAVFKIVNRSLPAMIIILPLLVAKAKKQKNFFLFMGIYSFLL